MEELIDDDTLFEAAKLWGVQDDDNADHAQVRSTIVADEEVETPLAQSLREAILRDYAGTVFRDRVWGDPPERGPHGAAKLYLKPGAKPVCGSTIRLSGKRLEAMEALEADWKLDNKLEPGRGPWMAAAFSIPKKDNN